MSRPPRADDGAAASINARLEQVPGVAAASVLFDHDGVVRQVRIAALDTTPLDRIRRGVQGVLDELDVPIAADALRIGTVAAPPTPNGSTAGATAAPAGSPGSEEAAAAAPTPERRPEIEEPAEAAGSAAPHEEPAPAPSSGPARDEEPSPWHGRFLLLVSVDSTLTRTSTHCRVELDRLERRFVGEARDLNTELGRARAAARAALDAVQQAAPAVSLALEGIQVVPLFGHRYVVVAVEAAGERRFQTLAALVALEPSVEHAAALACLRAVERWIAW